MTNPLAQLAKAGQSVWYDQMERKLVKSGKLAEMIDRDDLRGLTSNPTIFEKAIGGSEDYDGQLGQLAGQGKSRDEIYDELVIEDIANAADVFRPVYDRTNGEDGYVSLEVSPLLAHDTEQTISEAKRLFARLGRPNVMIKIPATPAGIPAIEAVIAENINVNVTLIFSLETYHQVMEAYLRGLERRAEKNLPVGDIASVASFFVSRIDAQADKQLEAKIATTTDPAEKAKLESLLGKIAIANAKMAYQAYKQVFGSDRFLKLRDRGARPQRALWASTGTKNAKYSDVLYVETLIGPDTVNTVPPATYEAFRDHGRPVMTLDQGIDEAKEQLALFESLGFSLKAITEQLTKEGVKSFDESFVSLMATIEARRDAAVRRLGDRITIRLGSDNAALIEPIAALDKAKFAERIWKKDASLWKSDDAHKKIIANSLGWLSVVESTLARADEITSWVDSVRAEFDHVVVLGMGGSSLASEVLRRVFGKKSGYPALSVLDSTHPEAVAQLEKSLDLKRTLFIVASKSGTTTEPVMFHRYFYERMKTVAGDRAGQHFIAITDPDTQLGRDADRDAFRKVFVNPADIGGRYSALSLFGMVPAALSGVDIRTLLDRAVHAAHVSMTLSTKKNPAALLGAAIGAMALRGRDKLTLIAPAPLDTLGLWIEQLVAESTGKEGKGIVPIAGEPELDASAYGGDRFFVAVHLRRDDVSARLRALTDAGHPVLDMVLEDELDLGETLFVWEFATAAAGLLLGINPFDQPNVQESKDNTKQLLDQYKQNGRFDDAKIVSAGTEEAAAAIAALLGKVKAGDYVAITQYFAETEGRDAQLQQVRRAISSGRGVAVTTGYGPRFLHSTGQLHKGGADNGVFLQLTGDSEDVAIPGESFSFGVLARAQAIGDFASLESRNRRALRVHLGNDIDKGLAWLASAVGAAASVK
jgi:transaldolase/glucose-6-phosphate isomerase